MGQAAGQDSLWETNDSSRETAGNGPFGSLCAVRSVRMDLHTEPRRAIPKTHNTGMNNKMQAGSRDEESRINRPGWDRIQHPVDV